jgi:hypothetical protein
MLYSIFVWLISHQPAVIFSQNKPAPPISHHSNEQTVNFGKSNPNQAFALG